MKPTKAQIDKAVEAYNSNRVIAWSKSADSKCNEEHFTAIRSALETVGEPYDYQVSEAGVAYNKERSYKRWDGFKPWGECGAENHRKGIKAAMQSFNLEEA